MATGVFMPKLSMTMETGTILQWFKQEGDDVREGDILLEVMTDKINIEVESYSTGKLLKIYYGPDQVVPVNQIIGYVGEADEQVPDSPPPLAPSQAPTGEDGEVSAGAVHAEKTSATPDQSAPAGEKIRATPVARRIARDNRLNLHQINGSGPNGRIQKIDVERALSQELARQSETGAQVATGTGNQPVERSAREVKLEGMRKVIAQRMAESAYTAPHVTLTTEADMSRAIELRTELLPVVEKQTTLRLSYTDIIVKAVACALSRHPKLNVSLIGDMIHFHEEINVGLAVAVPDGLLVPVIKNADKRGLADMTAESKRLAELARGGRLLPDDMRGGTFTISNLGMYAIDAFTPIINQPESAILGVGRILEKPVGRDGQIVLRPMMALSLSFDHRVIDGAPAAAFLQEIKGILESPYQLLV